MRLRIQAIPDREAAPMPVRIGVAICAVLLGAVWAQDARTEEPPAPGASYMRVARPNKDTTQLEIAARKFLPVEGTGPAVWLTAVVHLGDAAYYERVQERLDERGLVLYEGVGRPAFLDGGDDASDPTRGLRTWEAIRFAALQAERYRRRHGAYPVSLGVLRQEVTGRRGLEGGWMRAALTDGWGRPLRYERSGDSFTLLSRGSDGEPGGEGYAADLRFADQPPFQGTELAASEPIQSALAEALGLVFQLDAIRYDRPHFQNSDMSMGGLRRTFTDRTQPRAAGGEDAADRQLDQIVRMMDGSSFSGSLLKLATRVISGNPRLRAIVKLALIEMIGRLDGDLSRMQGLPPEMADLMKVLIRDRNRIVVRDLRAALSSDDPPESISVFYGAGHMADLERRLTEELGYRPAEQVWLPAFSTDLTETGLGPAQIEMMRSMIESQMKMMRGGP